MSYESTFAGHGVVAAPHHLASEAGATVIAEGGNAVEAMIAAAAVIAVVYPHMNQFGGDGFWLIREPSGRIRYIEAAGFAGEKATRAFYEAQGFDRIPSRGPLAALTVPGQIGGWMLALEAAKALGGRMPLSRLLEPAIAFARNGAAVSRSQSRLTLEKLAELKDVPGFAATFLAEGKAPETGTIQRFPRLADTLAHLASAGLEDFYRGDVGREIAADLERVGSPVTRADLERYRAVLRPPLSVKLAGMEVFSSAPPTQGLATLMILGQFDRLGVARAESFEHVHGLIEATKRAFLVRDRVITDFERMRHDASSFLTPAALEREAAQISMRRALDWPQPAGKGDTVWLGAGDKGGVAVSYIQSVYWEFGSGVVSSATGVLMQNRGTSFALDPAAPNPLEPGRWPFHTLNPCLAELADGRVIAFGTMGGEGQPQTNAAVLTRHALFGVPLGAAIERPRWVLGPTWGTGDIGLRIEPRFDGELYDRLERAGHNLSIIDEPYSDVVGHAGAVILHPRGRIEGAHDPRSDGGAAGV
ncbi:gamma-glutamyltransferase [Ancylobacter sp. 6x-1]|uniref:Gamma-glutamyltransferase n=1 Tax=Ancylobacter crimeensis TaxID=2579147 RepID=A0ABT0DD65_9HYPH|nr:gamma-glutamyltransferase [Ancylobacter crimeensis]MCK0197901.1 gamma-glutamyltransferase [Ancylobacter crimeensis]